MSYESPNQQNCELRAWARSKIGTLPWPWAYCFKHWWRHVSVPTLWRHWLSRLADCMSVSTLPISSYMRLGVHVSMWTLQLGNIKSFSFWYRDLLSLVGATSNTCLLVQTCIIPRTQWREDNNAFQSILLNWFCIIRPRLETFSGKLFMSPKSQHRPCVQMHLVWVDENRY